MPKQDGIGDKAPTPCLLDVIPDFRDQNVNDLLNDTIGNFVLHAMLDNLNEFFSGDVGQMHC